MPSCPAPFAALVSLALLASPASAQMVFASDPTPRVTVTGSGAIEVQPDTAKVSLGVYVLDNDLRRAKATSDEAVLSLLEAIRQLGIEGRDVTSSVLDFDPTYSDSETVPPEFLGYEISRSVHFILRDLAKLDQLVDRAIEAGANRQFNVELTTSKLKELQDQALQIAMEDARVQAQRLAAGFGAKLGAVRIIGSASGSNSMRTVAGSTASFGTGTFAPGTITVRSELSVTFVLEP